MIKEENVSPKFDEVGNLITKNPNKIEELEKEPEELINGKDVFCCQYCGKEWDKKVSNTQHERWCKKNPNPRKHRNKGTKKPKKPEVKSKGSPKKEVVLQMDNFMVEELRKIDRTFGLTDEQIVDYIRGKKRE